MLRRLASRYDCARAQIAQWRRRFDARAPRERVLVIGVAVVLVWFVSDQLWLSHATKSWSSAQLRRSAAVVATQRLNLEAGRRGQETRSAEAQLRADVSAARERVDRGDATLRAFGASLVSAPEMVPMLDHLLARSGGVRLRSMQSLGRVEVGVAGVAGSAALPDAGAASAAAASPAIAVASSAPASGNLKPTLALYRHGVELTIEGSYADVLGYVQGIEAMPQRVLWGGLQLKVEQHPLVVLTLRLYTLSPDRSWLEI